MHTPLRLSRPLGLLAALVVAVAPTRVAAQAQTGITKGASARTDGRRTMLKNLTQTGRSQAHPPMRACPPAREPAYSVTRSRSSTDRTLVS